MGTLYIDRRGIDLSLDGRQLLLREPGRPPSHVPLSHLERIVLRGRATLGSRLLGALSEQGIAMVIINPRWPGRSLSLPVRAHKDAARRLAQYQRSLDEDWKARIAAIIVARKIRGQRNLLTKALARRPDQRHELTKGRRFLSQRLSHLGKQALNRETLRGIEGAAALAYFKAYGSLFPASLDFTGRNRRPPRDPVNVCLSLAYTLLNADAVLAIQSAGLDPMLGFYHDTAYGRDSLACDVIEPLRPAIDEWVWGLFRERSLRVDHFSPQQGACLLQKAGRKVFYTEWESFAGAYRRRLRRYLRILVHSLAPQAKVDDR